VEDSLERERDQHAKNLQMAAGDLGRWKFVDAVLSAESCVSTMYGHAAGNCVAIKQHHVLSVVFFSNRETKKAGMFTTADSNTTTLESESVRHFIILTILSVNSHPGFQSLLAEGTSTEGCGWFSASAARRLALSIFEDPTTLVVLSSCS